MEVMGSLLGQKFAGWYLPPLSCYVQKYISSHCNVLRFVVVYTLSAVFKHECTLGHQSLSICKVSDILENFFKLKGKGYMDGIKRRETRHGWGTYESLYIME